MLLSGSDSLKNQQNGKNIKLNEKAYYIIKENLIEGVIQPGTFLTEKDLIGELGISRTPVREALQKLETENFIRIYPKRGIFIPEISIKDIKDIYSIREVLEPFAAKLATNNVNLNDIEKYRKIFNSIPEEMDVHEFIKLDHEFHKIIFQQSDNNYLINILIQFYEQQLRIRNKIATVIYHQKEKIYKEHIDIIEALSKQDANEVEQKMKVHLTNATIRIMKHLL